MSTQQMLASAREALKGTTVNADEFFYKLATHFGYDSHEKITDGDLRYAKWEDLEECGLPKGKARQIAGIFRADEPESITQPSGPITVTVDSDDPEVQAKRLSPHELIDRADLTSKRDAYSKRLEYLAESRRFVVYNVDGSKNVEKTLELFNQLEDYGESDTVLLDSVPRPVYYVGDRPAKVVEEHPLHPGRALRPDNPFNKVEHHIRQLLFVAVSKTNELDPNDYYEIDLVREAMSQGFEYLAQKYSKAAVELQKMEATGRAPALKITVQSSRIKGGKITDDVGSNNPFLGENHTT